MMRILPRLPQEVRDVLGPPATRLCNGCTVVRRHGKFACYRAGVVAARSMAWFSWGMGCLLLSARFVEPIRNMRDAVLPEGMRHTGIVPVGLMVVCGASEFLARKFERQADAEWNRLHPPRA